MAIDWSLGEQLAHATLLFMALSTVPFLVVAAGFFPDSGFARRVYFSDAQILEELDRQREELTVIREDIEILRNNSNLNLGWFEHQTSAVHTIAETSKEKMY